MTMASSRCERDSSTLSAPITTSNAVPAPSPDSVRKDTATATTSNAVTAPSRNLAPVRRFARAR